MVDPLERQSPPRLVGYESWLYQMPCIDSSGDVFVSVPLSGHVDLPSEPPNRWLIALGDVCGKGETASRLKRRLGDRGDPAGGHHDRPCLDAQGTQRRSD